MEQERIENYSIFFKQTVKITEQSAFVIIMNDELLYNTTA